MILERRIKKRDLNKLDILIKDTSNEFLQAFDVPDSLPQGRSSFTINGSEFLKTNTEVLVEILDNDNNPIFVNPIYDPDYVTMQGTSRSISVEVYPNTPGGRAILTIVGELDHEKFIGTEPLTPEILAQLNIETDPLFTGDVSIAQAVANNFFIPEQYRGVYNVKYNKIILINPRLRNTAPIRFYRRPQIQARELIRTQIEASSSKFLDTVNVSTGSIKGKRINPEKTLRLINPAEIDPVRAVISCDSKPAPQGGYTDTNGPNTLTGTIYNRSYPLEVTSEDSYGSIIRRSWEFGDAHVTESYVLPDSTNPKGVEKQKHIFTKPGTYKVKLTVASPTGQYDLDTETVTLSAPSAPVAEFTVAHPTASADGSTKRTGSMDDDKSRTFKFKDASTGVDNIVDPLIFGSKFSNLADTEYSWSFGDGNTANGMGNTARNPEHTYAQSGSYTVKLTVKNNYGAQSDSETKTNHILIKESLPIVDFSVNSGSITQANALGANANAIKGATATFTNSTVYYGSSITYAWTFNSSGSTSTSTNPTCIYTGSYDAGKTFDVTLTATDNYGRSVTKTKKNLIGIAPSIPQPNFTATVREFTLTGSFEARRVQFTDTSVTSSACTYQYDFNGGTVGSKLNSGANSSTFEAANLTGGIFEAGVSSPLTLGITHENPRAGTRCLKLANGGSSAHTDAYTYGYDYGNSGEASLSAWISQYSLATITQNYMYTLEFWARADEPTTIMTGMFGCNANGHTFGSGPAQGTFAVVPQKVGTSWKKFNWSWRFTDPGCKYLSIRLGAETLNPGKAVYFDNVEVYNSTSTSKNPAVDYRTKTDGSRGLVKQSVTNAVGTERSIQLSNFINAQFGAPSASFTIDDQSVLTQVPVTFQASGSAGFSNIKEYRWEWGDGDFDITKESSITHKYSSAATYTPKLQVLTDEGQSTKVNVGNVVVSAPPAPTVSLGFMDGSTSVGETPHEILVKATTTNQVTSSNITFGNGDSTNSTRGFTVYNTPGTYTVTATVAGPGGSASATKTITVTSPPDPPKPPIDEIEDPEPEITKDQKTAAETGTSLGSGGGSDPAPPATYTGGGGGGDPYTGCVLAGTIIKTARGDVPVEQVTTEDLVYSWDFNKNEFGYYNIEKAWTKKQPIRVFVETESGKSVECSDTHLFYHPDYKDQEICIKDLNVGDIVYSLNDDGEIFEDPIRNITTYDDEEVEVYNFNVPKIYSYITNNIISHNKEKYESEASDPLKTQFEMNLASPETDFFEIETDQTGEFFKKEMLGADLTIFPNTGSTDMDTLNKQVPADRRFIIKQQPLVTKIRKIGPNGRVIIPDIKGLMVTNRLNAHKDVVFSEYQDFGPATQYSMSYQKPVTASFRVINKKSKVKLNLTQLRPYSGEIRKVKVYYKVAGQVGGYQELAEIKNLRAPELLADPSVQFHLENIGVFAHPNQISKYWFSRQGENAGFYKGIDSSTPTAGLTHTVAPYPNSMRISGSNYPYNSVVSSFHKHPMKFVAGTEYALTFNLAGIKKNKQHTPENAAATGDTSEQGAKIRFYLSGSSLQADDGWGHLLGVMELDTYGAVSESFDKVEHNFIAENNGDGRLQLVAESGEWYINDISFKPMMESGFSPDFTAFVENTPKLSQRNALLEYYAEFYDCNNNSSDLLAIGQSPKRFEGSSTIVEGVDNTISGSLFLGGDSEGSGIEIHGGSSYVRNVGYVGYYSASQAQSIDTPELGKAGFMFWSGSLLTDRTDEYNQGDVGFEIHGGPGVKDGTAGAMRFRSSTGKLEVTGSIVATDGHFQKNFSVGTGSAAIEISSSKHIMKTKSWGHPTSSKGWAISGSGQAYFQEGYIGGWQIKTIDEGTTTERAVISGSNITLDADGAGLYMSNKGPGSDSSNTFSTLADEYYLDFTPDTGSAVSSSGFYVSFGPKFKIDKDGVLFASGAKFVGTITASAGLLGGFNIGSASMFSQGGTEGMPNFFFSGSAIGSSFNKGNLFISSSGFQVNSSGSIKALSGQIASWDISGDTISSLNGSGKGIILDADASTPIITIKEDSSNKIELYHTTDSDWGLKGISSGDTLFRLGNTNTISGWELTENYISKALAGHSTTATSRIYLSVEADNQTQNIQQGLHIYRDDDDTTDGHVKIVRVGGLSNDSTLHHNDDYGIQVIKKDSDNNYSNILYIGKSTQTISGWTIGTDSLSAGSGGSTIKLIPGTGIQMGHGTFGSAPFSVTNAGVLKSTSGTVGGWTLSASDLSAGSGGSTIKLIPGTGIQMGHGTFGSAPFSVTNAGFLSATSGKIGGWNVGSTMISSSNLNISSTGLLETSDYASGFKGWRISSQDNGFAEFENVRIRGTLKTAVFEKETVNAVGGQLYVANSTTVTGSNDVGISDTVIQVANASGFAAGEVITAKKVTATGFGTEYMLVQSVARVDASSDTNMSGSLTVVRAYGKVADSGSGGSGSLGGSPSASQTYGPGQVIVSTGKIDTGYIRLNANPNDIATPYMDIVERTGSGVYDVDLKVRLGDLSGLSSGRLAAVSAPADPGFGLYTDNVYLKGAITATTGSIGGVKMQSSKLYVGTGTQNNSNTGFYLDSSGNFSLGDKLTWDGSNLDITGTITLTGGQSLGAKAYYSASAPSASGEGDIWYDSDDGNKPYIATGSGVNKWQEVADDTIATAQAAATSGSSQIDTMNSRVVLSSAGMALKNSSGTTLADYGADATIGKTSGTNRNVYIDSDSGVQIRRGTQVSASFGAETITLGPTTGRHVSIDTDSVDMKTASTTHATFGSTSVIGTSTDKVTISDSGITIRENNVDTIQLSSGAVIVGEVGSSKSNVQITSGAINLRNNTTNKMTLAADGSITIGSNVSIAADGTAEFDGSITGGSLSIGSSNSILRVDTDGDLWIGHATQGSAPFQVTKDGAVTASNITITGGGLSIGSSNSILRVDTDGDMWIGHATQGSAPFQVTKDGAMTASNITITGGSLNINSVFQVSSGGAITSTSGTIGGWTVASTLSATNILLDPSTPKITLGSKATLTDSNTGLYLGTDGIALGASSVFKVTHEGALTAKSGTVGGWTLAASTLQGGDKVLLDQGNSKIVIADDVTDIDEGLTISYGTAQVGDGSTANKCHIIAGTDTDMAINVDYENDLYVTPGRLRHWYVTSAGGHDSDPSADGIGGTWLGGAEGTCGPRRYDAGIMGISSNLGGNLADNEVNASVIGSNSRGAGGAAAVGVFGIVNRGHVAGVLGECVGGSTGDKSDWQENNTAGMFRGGPLIVGNAWTGSVSEPSDTDHDYCFIAYPRTKFSATHENRVGINIKNPSYALHVTGEIYATSNITAYSDRRSKKNIEFISGSLNLINQLRGVRFDWKKPEEIAPDRYGKSLVDNPVGRQVGMIAQEVQKVLPELVEEDPQYGELSLKYSNLVGVLVNAVNELTDKVNKQEKQIKELQNG